MKTAAQELVEAHPEILVGNHQQIIQALDAALRVVRISALKEAAHVVLIATRIPEGARNPTRDFLVIKGEEISNLILSLANKQKEGTK